MPLVIYGLDGPLWALSGLHVEAIDADLQVIENEDGCPPVCCRRRGVCPPEKTYYVRILIETKTDLLEKSFPAPTLEAANMIMTSAIEVAAQLEQKAADAAQTAVAPAVAPALPAEPSPAAFSVPTVVPEPATNLTQQAHPPVKTASAKALVEMLPISSSESEGSDDESDSE